MSTAMRVLFVDDDPKLLSSLRRMTLARGDLDALFAQGGREAMEILDRQPIDIVVVDMRMPGMDGVTLLEQVQEKHQDIIRIVLSGHSEENLVRRSVGLAHQFLSKPCPFDQIMAVLQRLYGMRSILTNKSIRSVVNRIGMLPVLPDVYSELTRELERDDCSLSRVGAVIARDVGLAAGVLKVVNSSFFGVSHSITTLENAVTFLGTDLIRGLVLSNKLFTTFDVSKHHDMSVQLLWSHSLNTAFFCRTLAGMSEGRIAINHGFNAGLLHDIGKLILADRLPEVYAEILTATAESDNTVCELEYTFIGCTHAEMGAYLLGLWGFPVEIVKSVAGHHGCGYVCDTETPLTGLVHIANVLEHELVIINSDYTRPVLDEALIENCGLRLTRLGDMRQACAALLGNGFEKQG